MLELNSLYAMMQAIQSGLGIGALPDYMASETPGLTRILEDLNAPKVDVYFVHPDELRSSKRVAAFRDFPLARPAEMA